MPKTWKSSKHAAKDITRSGDFDESNEDESQAFLSKDMSYRAEKTCYQFLDPRTGEEIDIQDESGRARLDEKNKSVSIGRGQLIEEFRENSKRRRLQKQLRMNRPLGFRNDMIESYFMNHKEAESPKNPSATGSKEIIASPTETVGKSRRRSNAKNVLMSSILEKMELNSGGQALSKKVNSEHCRTVCEEKCDSDRKTCEGHGTGEKFDKHCAGNGFLGISTYRDVCDNRTNQDFQCRPDDFPSV